MEEDLINVNSSFLHGAFYKFDIHLSKLALYYLHALTLKGHVIIHGVDLLFLGNWVWIRTLQQVYPHSIAEEPCSIEVKWSGPLNRKETENIFIKVHRILNRSAYQGYMVHRHKGQWPGSSLGRGTLCSISRHLCFYGPRSFDRERSSGSQECPRIEFGRMIPSVSFDLNREFRPRRREEGNNIGSVSSTNTLLWASTNNPTFFFFWEKLLGLCQTAATHSPWTIWKHDTLLSGQSRAVAVLGGV